VARWRRRPGALLVGGLLLLLLAAGAYRLMRHPAPHPRSLAVLPFRNLTGKEKLGYLADKATEALTVELGKNPALRVVSRTTAARYHDSSLTLPEIARVLDVRWVVEGGVGVEGDEVLLKVSVVDAFADRKGWAESYTSDLGRLSAVHTQAAQAIAKVVKR
jgi:TolB-like protein